MTYENGIELAKSDIEKHGELHALDKYDVLDGELGRGYREVIEKEVLYFGINRKL